MENEGESKGKRKDKDKGSRDSKEGETVVPHNSKPSVTPEVQDHLGLQLRKVYSNLVAEPLPDRFEKLLQDLAAGRDKGSAKEESDR